MGMVIIYSLPSIFSSSSPSSSFSIRGHGLISSLLCHRRCHQLLLLQGLRPIGISKCRFAGTKEQDALAAMPDPPAGLYAPYTISFAGNLVEQLWNVAWPAAVAVLHPSLLPVAVHGFFTRLSIFTGHL